MKPIRIAVASGKGGTGKTTLATNLAKILSERGESTAYLDCDVEEPNGHIFMNPILRKSTRVTMPVPEIDETRCTYCGACAKACRFVAISVLGKNILTFPNLCHGCGGCSLACPEGAIREVVRPIGTLEEGVSGLTAFVHGRLDVGEAMSPPLIRAVLEAAPKDRTLVLDAPPGTSCPVIESVKSADVVLLVTEPTPFGIHDLRLAVDMVKVLGLPFGIAVNRVGMGNQDVYDYAEQEGIPILLELPDDRRIAEAYSRGEMAVQALPQLRGVFENAFDELEKLALGPRPSAVPRMEPVRRDGPLEQTPTEKTPPDGTSTSRELVVISGKGGTGKTSITASFMALEEGALVADCDVDAADLHLVLDPALEASWPFSGGSEAVIDPDACSGCGTCADLCRFEAISQAARDSGGSYEVDPVGCEGCGVCADNCPEGAARMVPSVNGEWFISRTRFGPLVHARLGVAQENSGKLVFTVRREAKALADAEDRRLLIVDGAPGIGCPVIASITGAQMALIVTEPTLSGMHDMHRVAELTKHFDMKTAVCINKADINPEITARLEQEAREAGLQVLGKITYDPSVTRAQIEGKSVVETGDSPAAREIRELWIRVRAAMDEPVLSGGERTS